MSGYALVTDDGLQTIGSVAQSMEWLETCDEPSARFDPVEWIYGEGSESFDQLRKALVDSGDAATARNELATSHVEPAFRALVTALGEMRAEGVCPPGVFLTVLSTDPNDLLRKLEDYSVAALNSEATYQDWVKSRQYWVKSRQ